jgi:hypothetical protein
MISALRINSMSIAVCPTDRMARTALTSQIAFDLKHIAGRWNRRCISTTFIMAVCDCDHPIARTLFDDLNCQAESQHEPFFLRGSGVSLSASSTLMSLFSVRTKR